MMARPYCVVVALLLLAEVFRLGEGASNPGFVVRITRKGLEYARQYGMATLKKELSTINVPDLSGSFEVGWMGSVSYEFKSLRIHSFQIRNSDLSLLPGRGVRASLSNNYVSISGNWKVKKAFITLQGTFDLSVDGVSISIYLNLGEDGSGRPTASVAHCSNSVGHVSIHISGNLSWLLNLFHKRIENKLKDILKQEICEIVRTSTSSHLEPYLRTLPVTLMIDQVAGIDYSLVGAPQVTSQGLDTPFKGEFFGRSQRSPVPFDAPPIRLPQQHDLMAYFAVSQYVFNTASRVYHQAGHMNFTIRNEDIQNLTEFLSDHSAKEWRNPSCLASETTPFITTMSCFLSNFLLLLQSPLDFPIHLHTKSLGAVIPQLARLYPNTELELEMSPESAPFLMFTPGNVTCLPVMNIQAFALLPNSSNRKPLFQLRARTDISATISVSSSRVLGSLTPGSKLKLELKHSNIGFFNVQLLESIFNYYASYIIYPSLNAKFEKGFPLPLPRDTYLNSLELQAHKNFLFVGANID
ncbi:PREDICTED: lipopolysaccharide-binding protein [Myotis brandtii]|uniref:lipopolysaccharide-binding protein n=1 Tax=Myotis brandtii TaxID=109478 RepID=UPI0007042BFB|nr:PREDICTED: lipopolysaccharide-binding protein [Myotis brandtii]